MSSFNDSPDTVGIPESGEQTASTPVKSALDEKINEHFPGRVVRKDLVKAVRGNAVVPSYVLEYLLAQYAASDDEATILSGIDTVRKILATHYVKPERGGAREVGDPTKGTASHHRQSERHPQREE
ncbi:hypothetical protein JFX23_02785 [Schaalia cardiffensis]|uniref:anti-phage BREX system Lon protease BrxL n=1 Tax=Schaalia cardiffensis TaxID=181487 RepID=UPI0018E7D32F|nr:anti-phage BREX system Lon protease BrxL [Schaalia cardiffensis]MBJ2328704.1 hypothetical protein [Schaalia cardiffensis]